MGTELRDAARQALEALELLAQPTKTNNETPRYKAHKAAITTLRAALEQPEQEPVAWCDIEEDGTIHGLRYWSEPGRREHALYTHPPRREWRGLTEEELRRLWRESTFRGNGGQIDWFTEGARVAEAALRSKNYD
jgi:hypothetical protein